MLFYFYNSKFKKLNSGYDCFWYMLVWLHPFLNSQTLAILLLVMSINIVAFRSLALLSNGFPSTFNQLINQLPLYKMVEHKCQALFYTHVILYFFTTTYVH